MVGNSDALDLETVQAIKDNREAILALLASEERAEEESKADEEIARSSPLWPALDPDARQAWEPGEWAGREAMFAALIAYNRAVEARPAIAAEKRESKKRKTTRTALLETES